MMWVDSVLYRGRLVAVDDRGQVWLFTPDYEVGVTCHTLDIIGDMGGMRSAEIRGRLLAIATDPNLPN